MYSTEYFFKEKQIFMVASKFPTTRTERLELGPDAVRLPASWKEYLDLLETCEYPVEFDDNQIILMSIASNPHEAIVANILGLLYNLLDQYPDMQALGINRHVFIKEFQADYAPDAQVVKGVPLEHTLRKGLSANLNPHIIFEVLSPSTREYDLSTKLPRYKKIPTVRQIIYVEQTQPLVSVYTRIRDTNQWINEDFDQLEQVFQIEEQEVLVKDLYKKIVFE